MCTVTPSPKPSAILKHVVDSRAMLSARVMFPAAIMILTGAMAVHGISADSQTWDEQRDDIWKELSSPVSYNAAIKDFKHCKTCIGSQLSKLIARYDACAEGGGRCHIITKAQKSGTCNQCNPENGDIQSAIKDEIDKAISDLDLMTEDERKSFGNDISEFQRSILKVKDMFQKCAYDETRNQCDSDGFYALVTGMRKIADEVRELPDTTALEEMRQRQHPMPKQEIIGTGLQNEEAEEDLADALAGKEMC